MNPKRPALLATGAVAILLSVASVAYACTDVQGGTVITSISGGDKCGGGGILSNRPLQCRQTETWAQVTWPLQPPDSTTYNGLNGSRQYDVYPGVNPGDGIQAYGVGAEPSKYYSLYFLNHWQDKDEMLTCMSWADTTNPNPQGAKASVKISSSSAQSSTGGRIPSLGTVGGTIPATAQDTNAITGPAAVCFISQATATSTTPDYAYATNAAFLTVLKP